MKVCEYCGAENNDSALVCSLCGGNEFKHKCDNCGTLFEEGNYCPKCGVKAGTKAKKCPNCGAEYYSAACPDCGYTNTNNGGNTTIVYTKASEPTQPVKKRKTWLWVLGWIFIFPVPLTILMVKNQKLNKFIKIGIIAVAWIVYLLIAFGAGSLPETGTDANGTQSTVESSETQEISQDNKDEGIQDQSSSQTVK